MRRRRALTPGPALVAAVLLAGPLRAQAPGAGRPRVAHVGRVTVVAAPAQMTLALSLAEAADQPMEFPGLGRVDPQPLTLIVVQGDSAWRAMSRGQAPPWGAAVTLEGPRSILLRADAGDWRRVLRHELAHLALHQESRTPVPRWFDEGYASWAAGEWDRLDALTLSGVVLRGEVPTLSALDGRLHDRVGDPGAAYALSMAAVIDLATRNRSGTLASLLGLLREGVPFDQAVQRTTGLAPDRFEDAWRLGVRKRYGVYTWLLAGGAWLVVPLVLFLLVRRRRRLDAPRRAQLDVGWVVPEAPEDAEGDELDHDPQR